MMSAILEELESRMHLSLPGDANGDHRVDSLDFAVVAANFNQQPRTLAQGDFTGDGRVNLLDFSVLATNFGRQAMPLTDTRFLGSVSADVADAPNWSAGLPGPTKKMIFDATQFINLPNGQIIGTVGAMQIIGTSDTVWSDLGVDLGACDVGDLTYSGLGQVQGDYIQIRSVNGVVNQTDFPDNGVNVFVDEMQGGTCTPTGTARVNVNNGNGTIAYTLALDPLVRSNQTVGGGFLGSITVATGVTIDLGGATLDPECISKLQVSGTGKLVNFFNNTNNGAVWCGYADANPLNASNWSDLSVTGDGGSVYIDARIKIDGQTLGDANRLPLTWSGATIGFGQTIIQDGGGKTFNWSSVSLGASTNLANVAAMYVSDVNNGGSPGAININEPIPLHIHDLNGIVVAPQYESLYIDGGVNGEVDFGDGCAPTVHTAERYFGTLINNRTDPTGDGIVTVFNTGALNAVLQYDPSDFNVIEVGSGGDPAQTLRLAQALDEGF